MQLNVFNTDNQKSGFRLQYLEVFNWGTFDNHVYSIKPEGETSLLTGANGSGKTTFVDALLTLIVPEKKYRFYNQSSGSEKKGDRTEESYVLGGYATLNNELTGVTRTLYLREQKEEAYSILLVNFANETEQTVTLFQVRYFANGEMKKIFGVAHKALHVDEDFKPFDLAGNWKKAIDAKYNKAGRKQVEWYDAASKYAQRLVDVLGMQSLQALSLFNQTVGIKVLGNLDEFIRTHMLEPRNMEEEFIELKKHLATLIDAQRNIEKSEEQIKLLKPLQQHYQKYESNKELLKEARLKMETATIWNRYTKYNLLQDAILEENATIKALHASLEACKNEIRDLHEQERSTRNQMEQNKAGQRLKQLEQDAKELSAALQMAEKNRLVFTEWCHTLKLEEQSEEVTDEAMYKRAKSETRKANLRIETEKRLIDEDEFEAKDTFKEAVREREDLEKELNNMLHSKNNIPGHLIQLRKDICTELKLDTGDLPFAGELMQVHRDELKWEAALEKLLHGFALRLLIPEKYYKKVNKYVNNTNLGKRLVYYRVDDVVIYQNPDPGTVHEKLEFHPEHKMSEWLEQQVIRQFNFVCLNDEKTLDRYDQAITVNGLIKSRDRHEKDDRPDRNDPGRYVMGWNNEKKREALKRRREELTTIIDENKETLERCKRRMERINNQVYALKRIEEHEGFESMNVAAIQRKMRVNEEQMESLKESSDHLKSLTSQLEDIRQYTMNKDRERSSLDREIALREEKEKQMIQLREELKPLVALIDEDGKEMLILFQQHHSDALSSLNIGNIDSVYKDLSEQIQTGISDLENDMNKEKGQVERAVVRLKYPSLEIQQRFPDWSADVQYLSEDASHANEYIEWLEKLETENLPRFKRDFENYINDTITYKIGGLNEELEKWSNEIRRSILRLNQSLGAINFNRLPDTYIQLGHKQVTDTTVKDFRAKLLEALPQVANWQQSSFEEKAEHFKEKVQPLIAQLEESENYRARVLDVRNWFEFWADEKYRNTDELKKTYRQMGQLSGGEKAQLTYTILCSAIAYQFGITKEGENNRSLRFIAVDESFSNQDEEKATYLMELCKQLHLQLLVVTPSDKIAIVQNFIAHVHLVQRVANKNSVIYNMTIKELQENIAEKKGEVLAVTGE